MPTMRAVIAHPWGMSERKEAGDEYEASDQEAELLEALQWAERASARPRARLQLRHRDMRSSQSPTYETKDAT